MDYIESTLAFRLTTNIQALVAMNPGLNISDPTLLLEVTVAGYDVDESLKVGAITLQPKLNPRRVAFVSVERPHSHWLAACASAGNREQGPLALASTPNTIANTWRVNDKLFCDIAGIPEVAEHALASPEGQPFNDNPAIGDYLRARNSGRQLSTVEMRSLALALEQETANDEEKNEARRVGGQPKIAMFVDGKLVEEPGALADFGVGRGLDKSHFQNFGIECNDQRSPFQGEGGKISVRETRCHQLIDGMTFHDSEFIDSVLTFDGTTYPIIFAESNKITNTTLSLSGAVRMDESSVQHLICGFKWQAVYNLSGGPIPLCTSKGERLRIARSAIARKSDGPT